MFLNGNCDAKIYLYNIKIPTNIHYKLINLSGEITASQVALRESESSTLKAG